MSQIISKCCIVGCINNAAVKPVITVAMAIRDNGNPVAPLTLPFNDGVCRSHCSKYFDDYVTDAQLVDLIRLAGARGFQLRLRQSKVRFVPMNNKMVQQDHFTLDELLLIPGEKLLWRSEK